MPKSRAPAGRGGTAREQLDQAGAGRLAQLAEQQNATTTAMRESERRGGFKGIAAIRAHIAAIS